MKKLVWLSRRLKAMPPEEIILRAKRRVREEVERAGLLLGTPSIRDFSPQIEEQGKDERSSRFFFGSDEPVVIREYVATEKPEWLTDTLNRAGDVFSHRAAIFGKNYDLGERIDWSRDYSTGKLFPAAYWTRIDYRQGSKSGDPKIVWELNRHQHLVPLARAYFYTSDRKYLDEIVSQVDSWIDANPYLTGINWASPLELSLRLISWAWVMKFTGSAFRDDRRFYEKFLLSAYLQASHVEKNLSFYSSANNHLIGECAGLLFAGLAFPECRMSGGWTARASGILWKEAVSQIHEDGVGREQAFDYLLFVLELLVPAIILSEKHGLAVPESARNRVEKAFEFITHIMDSSGNIPRIGDSDEGRGFILSDGSGSRARALLSIAGIMYGREEFRLRAQGSHEEALWLFGLRGVAESEPRANDEIQLRSKLFEHGGYSVMRSGGTNNEKLGVLDFGELGYLSLAAHGHADCLSFFLSENGEELLSDPGTGCYHTDREFREYFRGSFAHNTLCLENEQQSESLGPFLWGRRANGKLRMWFSDRIADVVEAEHDGYMAKFSATHSRRVTFVKPDAFVVSDTVLGSGERNAVLRWHLPPGSTIVSSGEDGLTVTTPGGNQVLLVFFATSAMSQEWIEGRLSPPQGWFSPHLGTRVPSPTLELKIRGELPVSVTSLIFPLGKHGSGRKIRMKHLSPANSALRRQVHGVILEEQGASETYCVNPSGGEILIDTLRVKGKFVFIKEEGGSLISVAGSSLEYAERGGKRFFESPQPAEFISVDFSGAQPVVNASSETRARILFAEGWRDLTAAAASGMK